ncbi:DUF4830 domain-containing protein [Cohnella lupini]|uniref:Uncharacterized protein DUF4830 n=1 Tax=Cohnella lupini TaxID=1294267 RepID=A0A3D9I0G8_9BACL|nr:DUF4830 domain-containing protein [Cohnella lupini]RED55141.1 uncharacterized protein DUF4830 [Cohnella lupini]
MVKKMIVYFSLCSFVLLIGCGKELDEENPEKHIEYLESFGWHIKDKKSKETELINNWRNYVSARDAGIDLEPYNNKEMDIITYVLKEKQKTGKEIHASIYEINGDVIGGYGRLDDFLPGVFSLMDKEKLKMDGIMNQ